MVSIHYAIYQIWEMIHLDIVVSGENDVPTGTFQCHPNLITLFLNLLKQDIRHDISKFVKTLDIWWLRETRVPHVNNKWPKIVIL